MKKIILGISGGIAAYKAADIASQLRKAGLDIHVCMTANGAKFITPLTMQSLTKNRVHTGPLQADAPKEITHIDLACEASAVLIAPATANIISKIACGLADDMLTSCMLAIRDIPVFIAPAMNTRMYENPVIQENIERLKKRGFTIIEPKEGMLACGVVGKGALADVDVIVNAVLEAVK